MRTVEIPDCFSGSCFGSGLKESLTVKFNINRNKLMTQSTVQASQTKSMLQLNILIYKPQEILYRLQKEKKVNNLGTEAFTKGACGGPQKSVSA